MARTMSLPRKAPARRARPREAAHPTQAAEFLRLYLKVDEAGRRALRQLVCRSSSRAGKARRSRPAGTILH